MKKIVLFISSISLALLFSACGDGDGNFDTGNTTTVNGNDNNSTDTNTTTPTNVTITISNCETYTTLQTNDLLVKDTADTTVKIVHDSNGTKTICVVSGSAHLIREN